MHYILCAFLLVAGLSLGADLNLVQAHLLGTWRSMSMAADADGNTYVAGIGQVAATEQAVKKEGSVFLVKRDPAGKVVWATYVLDGWAGSARVALDGDGNPYVAGSTSSSFAATPNAFQTKLKGSEDAFVIKVSPAGNEIVYATLMGGDGFESVSAFTVTPQGEAVVTGWTDSYASFPSAPVSPLASGYYVAKLSGDGARLVYATAVRGTVAALASNHRGEIAVGGTAFAPDPDVQSLQSERADVDLHLSRDAGESWRTFGGSTITYDIAPHPGRQGLIFRATSTGLLRSRDGGDTWQSVEGLPPEPFRGVWFHPGRPDVVLASSSGGLYRSENGGADWAPAESAPPREILGPFFAAGERILAMSGSRRLYESEDDGRSWRQIRLETWDVGGWIQFDGRAMCCAVDPADSRHFLAGFLSITSSQLGVIETRDGGKSFRLISQNPVIPLAFAPSGGNVLYGYANHPVWAVASTGYVVFTRCLVKSEDGGKTWRLPKSGTAVPTEQVFVGPGGSGRVYAIGPLGVFLSDDSAENWRRLASATGNAGFERGVVMFGAPDSFYFLAARHGDGYLAKLDTSGRLVFSTLVGGSYGDSVTSVGLNDAGDVFAAGWTRSSDLFASQTSERRLDGGYEDGFVVKLSADGAQLLGLRYIGGGSTDNVSALAVRANGDVVALGSTASDGPGFQGAWDGYLTVLSPDLSESTPLYYVGGEAGDSLSQLSLSRRHAHLFGSTFSKRLGVLPLICEQDYACTAVLATVEFRE